MHEWEYPLSERPELVSDSNGYLSYVTPEPTEDLTTWIFEEEGFVPIAKLQNGERFSIFADHLGTPVMAANSEGKRIWECELDIYGKKRKETGVPDFIPFRYQGQYEDSETGLYYNRFRYYSPDEGMYISQDPIGLAGGSRLYGYVHDTNAWIDPLGLEREPIIFLSDGGGVVHPKTVNTSHPHGVYTIKATGSYAEDRKALAEAAKISDPGKNWRAHHIGYDSATNTMQMQFVHKDYHSYPHVGEADEFKQDTGFKYGSDDAIAEAKKRNKMLNKKTKSKTKYACK